MSIFLWSLKEPLRAHICPELACFPMLSANPFLIRAQKGMPGLGDFLGFFDSYGFPRAILGEHPEQRHICFNACDVKLLLL